MLYQLYETQRSLMEPFSDLAQGAAKAYGNPMSLFGQNPFSLRISAGYDLLHPHRGCGWQRGSHS
jgi:poly(3-hydroxybutyrate) depolymerase